MRHTEGHEAVILNHINGSLDEKSVTEALALLEQCKECQEIYESTLALKSKLSRPNIQTYLNKEDAGSAGARAAQV